MDRVRRPIGEHEHAYPFAVDPVYGCCCVYDLLDARKHALAECCVVLVQGDEDDVFAFHGRFLFAVEGVCGQRILAGRKRSSLGRWECFDACKKFCSL